jgi:glycosyltransferase involved in cell wall biosynthesis
MTVPEISVVIPTIGRWALLRHTLAAALAQEAVTHEVVVVHDGRGDDAISELEAVGDPRLRVVRTGGGLGAPAARNHGLAHVEAPWVSFLDDDDLWSPRKLRAQLDAAADGAAWVYGDAVDVDSRAHVLDVEVPPPPDAVRARLLRENVIPAGGSNVLVRSDLLRELGGFDPALNATGDWDMWLRLAAAGVPAYVGGHHIAYRRHDNNMHAGDPRIFLAELAQLEEKHRGGGFDPDRIVIQRWLAGGQRRAGRRAAAAKLYWDSARQHRTPGDLVRLAGALVGERAMAAGRRAVARRPHTPPEVAWLTPYQPDAQAGAR